jgi:hypothetical protein
MQKRPHSTSDSPFAEIHGPAAILAIGLFRVSEQSGKTFLADAAADAIVAYERDTDEATRAVARSRIG